MTALVRAGRAQWLGSLARGEGRLGTASGVLEQARYSFPTRFAQEAGTNPEELIAAAHAGCYAMALAYGLGQAGMTPERIEVTAELGLEMTAAGPEVTGIRLRVEAQVPGMAGDAFSTIAMQAKESCLVSRLLKTTVSLEARRLG
jgi:lipoyl-dependent peroxiredoxin